MNLCFTPLCSTPICAFEVVENDSPEFQAHVLDPTTVEIVLTVEIDVYVPEESR